MHQVDKPTLEYAKKLHPDIIGWVGPLHAKDGAPYFNTTQFVTANGTYVSVFSVKPVYYEAIGGYWRPLSEITSYHGNKRIELNDKWRLATPRFIDWLSKRQAIFGGQLLLPTYFGEFRRQDIARPVISLGLTTTTVYPDPNPETTTMDGGILAFQTETTVSQALWDELHDWNGTAAGVTGITDDTATSGDTYVVRNVRNPGVSNATQIGRAFFLFSTSAIGSDTISSATFSVYGWGSNGLTMGVVQSSPASNTALVTGDFDQCGAINSPTEGTDARVTPSNTPTLSYANWSLNATGRGWVNGSGVTKLGLRSDADITDSFPGSTIDQRHNCYYADVSGTSTDPKLVVEHTAGGAAFRPRVTVY